MWLKHSLSKEKRTESVFDIMVAALGQLYLLINKLDFNIFIKLFTIKQVLQNFPQANILLSV